jgi:NTE family protein
MPPPSRRPFDPDTRPGHASRHGAARASLLAMLVGVVACMAALANEGPAAVAPAAASPAAMPGTGQRPRIGLVLSGGGARGLAHVGVLKVLERERIPIDVIAGTSMGAIIGGLYASGMDAERLERELLQVEWSDVFANRVDRQDLSQRRKEEDFEVPSAVEFGLREGKVRAPLSAVSSRGLETLLRRYTLPVRNVTAFDRLPIPFRAVATDMETGQPVVLSEGDLALALRSSMSVPGVFAPIEVDGRILGDGGLVDNLPVGVARAMGADIVIAVNIGTPLAGRETLGSAIGVTAQMINILTEQNVQRAVASLRGDDVLVAPQLGTYTSGDFDRTRELIDLGAAGAEQALPRLAPLALEPTAYAAWRAQRGGAAAPAVVLEFIEFQGASFTNPERLQDQFESRAGQLFDRAKAENDTRRLAATGDYVRADYRIVRDGEREGILFELEEKPWGPDYLRVGLNLRTDTTGDNGFNLKLLHVRHWLNAAGAEWRNFVQLGEKPALATELYQPLNVSLGLQNDWFVAPHLALRRRPVILYRDQDGKALELARFQNDTQHVGVDLGRPWGSLGELRLGLGWLRYNNEPDSAVADLVQGFAPQRFTETGLRARAVVDQLDYAFFPTRGYRVEAAASGGVRNDASGSNRYYRVEIEASGVATFGGHTFDAYALANATSAEGLEIIGRYTLGGFQRLSGYRTDQFSGNTVALLRLGWRTPLTGTAAFTRGLVLGGSLEAGNAWQSTDDASWSDLRTGGSLYLGSDTGIGPVSVGMTYARRGYFGLVFYLGRP